MKHNIIAGICFAATMFMIPLLALNRGTSVMQPVPPTQSSPTIPDGTVSSPAESTPMQDEENVLEEDPESSPAVQTPAVQVEDDGFRLRDKQTGKVFEVSARDYTRGSLAAEMPPTFHPEALKAQAVAAHTYALQLKQQNREKSEPEDADFTVDPQNWKSYTTEKLFRERYGALADAYWSSICEAADEVCGYAMTYEGQPIVAAYHSMSSGITEDAANVWTGGKPYLVPVDSRGDTLAPDYVSKVEISSQALRDALKQSDPDLVLGEDPSSWLQINQRSEGGYVTEMAVGNRTMAGTQLRSLLDLRSADFEAVWDGTQFVFTVRGYGHGVGLSQYGADYMARQGASFDEILTHYYVGADLSPIA